MLAASTRCVGNVTAHPGEDSVSPCGTVTSPRKRTEDAASQVPHGVMSRGSGTEGRGHLLLGWSVLPRGEPPTGE